MSERATGRVILVGAGPGDPDLITLRGAAALREADVVVHDALVSGQLLELAPAGARRIDVGKRGHDAPTRSQEEISALLVTLAREGQTVVRLKGGDPFVFGRGGEEASACARAGVAFEVVPGVSSAFAAPAFAGIPLTDRRHAASFAVVTGHNDPTRVREEIRWDLLARSVDTLVILMGMRNLGQIVGRLLDGGGDPTTPAAAIMLGATPRQQVVEAPLGELVEAVQVAKLAAPSVVVVGDVVRLRGELAWYDLLPLFGQRVLVTRSAEQGGDLCRALRAAGAAPVHVPLLELVAPDDTAPLDAALDRLASYDAIAFASGNGVRFLAARAAERGKSLAGYTGDVFCVGPATAAEARRAGLRGEAVPQERFDAEGLLAEVIRRRDPAGRRFLLPRAAAGRELLAEGLRAAGAHVDCVVAYRNRLPVASGPELRGLLQGGELEVLTFHSPSAVRHLLEAAGPDLHGAVADCVLAAIGPLTAEALRLADLEPEVVPERASAAALVAALADRYESRRQGGPS